MKRPHNEFLYSIAGLQANPEKKVQASREVIPTIRAHPLKRGKMKVPYRLPVGYEVICPFEISSTGTF